ncbi:MAG: hypothetical protein K6B71_01520 [Alphaproteobacteria bacterium]|nr:hypothetical protein [Alphaproteobacteria bacterium]
MPTKTTKKTTKKVAKKTVKTTKPTTKVVKPVVPEMETHTCGCGGNCACGCHHHCGKFKKFIVLVIVFCLGFAVARICGHNTPRHHMPKFNPIFVNGCLDMESVKCPKMQEMLKSADVNEDGCVSVSELDTAKKAMPRPERHHNM